MKLAGSSTLRLIVFIVFFFLVYFFFGNTKVVIAIAVVGIATFLFLVSRHTDLQHKHDKLKALKTINEVEIQVLNRNFNNLAEGNEFKNPTNYFSQDIDLFGSGSFYQYTNRTALKAGGAMLANFFTENEIENIVQKQEAIKELSQKPQWQQEFTAIASLTKTQTTTETIEEWLGNYVSFVPKFMKYLTLAFSVVSLISFALYFLGFIHGLVLLVLMILGFAISAVFTKKIAKLGRASSKMQSTFEQYNKLLQIIENTEFKAELLNEKKNQIIKEGKKTSTILKEFSKLLGNLDQNNNVIYLFLGNGYFLRGLVTSYQIEQWIALHRSSAKEWFEVIAFFDAYISLGTFAFNHPSYVFPTITDEKIVLKSEAAGHPLLNPEKVF